MGWFDDQIEARERQDQEVMEDAIFRMAAVVLGKQQAGVAEENRFVTKEAIDEILRYYRCKPAEIPDSIKDPDEQLEYCLRPYGLMRRNVRLEKGWYKDAFGPMMGFRKEDGMPVALLPKPFIGYTYRDPATGRKLSVNARTAELFQEDALCFYKPLPLKKLGMPDLVAYMMGCLNTGDLLMIVALTLAATVFGMLMTNLTRALTGFVLQSGNYALLYGTAAFMLCVILSTQIISIVREMMMKRIETKTSLSVEAAMMMRVLNLPANFFRKYPSGELSSRYTAVNQLCELLLGNVFSVGLTSIMSLMYITQIFKYAPALVVPAILIILITVGFSLFSTFLQINISRQVMQKGAKENGLSFALISGVQKIKLAGAEKRMFARWGRMYAAAAKIQYDPSLLIKVGNAFNLMITTVGNIALYYMAVTNDVTMSQYIAFTTAFGSVSVAFKALADIAMTFSTIKPTLEMAEPILKAEPESSEGREILTSLSGNIELSNVSFRYNTTMPYVLHNLNLKVRSGEYIAIVGRTGCGKSTLVRLLLGFETPEKGAIYYDGKDINKLDLRSLRRRIGSVTQDGTLIQGEIFENIVISAPQLTLKDAWEAAEIAGIADDIREMPMGMNTMIAEGQGGISGGQKQRLMIARAVAPKPKILIFDEATSALDNLTQKKVSEALDGLKCTRIVIAHRLSTIRHCDRILMLEDGRIIESGTYEELIAKKGKFAEMVERQRLDTDGETEQEPSNQNGTDTVSEPE